MLIIFHYKSIYDFPHFADARSKLSRRHGYARYAFVLNFSQQFVKSRSMSTRTVGLREYYAGYHLAAFLGGSEASF